jgi:hypothetical protein
VDYKSSTTEVVNTEHGNVIAFPVPQPMAEPDGAA